MSPAARERTTHGLTVLVLVAVSVAYCYAIFVARGLTSVALLGALLLARPRAARPVVDVSEIEIDGVCSRWSVVQIVTSFWLSSLLCRSRLVVSADGLELSWRFGKRMIPWHAIRNVEAEATHVRLDLADGAAVKLPTRTAASVESLRVNTVIADIIEESRPRGGSPYRATGTRPVPSGTPA